MYNNLWVLFSSNEDMLEYFGTRKEARERKRNDNKNNWKILKFSQKNGSYDKILKFWGVYSKDIVKKLNSYTDKELYDEYIFYPREEARSFKKDLERLGCKNCKIKRYVVEGFMR